MTPTRATILVCDDDRLVLATLVHGLKTAGFDVFEADNGDDAILLARERKPDLALLDMRMNGKTGLDVAAYLRDHVGTPFMFLSAFNDEQIVRQAVAFGALAYLVKPLDVRQIVPAVRAALARASGESLPDEIESAAAAADADEQAARLPVDALDIADGRVVSGPHPPVPTGSEAFGAAIDLIARARNGAGEPYAEAMAIGILIERHRLSAAAARLRLGAIALERGSSEAVAAADILAASALLSGPAFPTR
jgi:two-component system, response regulator PdtaR